MRRLLYTISILIFLILNASCSRQSTTSTPPPLSTLADLNTMSAPTISQALFVNLDQQARIEVMVWGARPACPDPPELGFIPIPFPTGIPDMLGSDVVEVPEWFRPPEFWQGFLLRASRPLLYFNEATDPTLDNETRTEYVSFALSDLHCLWRYIPEGHTKQAVGDILKSYLNWSQNYEIPIPTSILVDFPEYR
jgi:hypothetical protein